MRGSRCRGSWRGGRGGRAGASAPASVAAINSPISSAASGGSWWRAASTTRISAARAIMSREMVRWKRPASECGQGSRGLTISRPRSESVQARLARAPVADVGLGAVAHQPALVVELVRPEVLAFRALPVVLSRVVGEAGGAVAQRSAVRVRGQPLEPERAGQQQGGVAGGQYDLWVHLSLAAVASSASIGAAPSG